MRGSHVKTAHMKQMDGRAAGTAGARRAIRPSVARLVAAIRAPAQPRDTRARINAPQVLRLLGSSRPLPVRRPPSERTGSGRHFPVNSVFLVETDKIATGHGSAGWR